MQSDPIKAALEVAGEAVRQNLIKPPCCMEGTGCELPPCHCSSVAAAAAITAFLNAPPPSAATIRLYMGEVSPQSMRDIYAYHRWLAAAVRRAAGGGE